MGVNNKGLEISGKRVCVCVRGGGGGERVTGDELDLELCPQGLEECSNILIFLKRRQYGCHQRYNLVRKSSHSSYHSQDIQ